MDFLKKLLAGAGAYALAAAQIANGQTLYNTTPPGGPPQVQTIAPNDLFQDITNGQAQANSYFVSGANLAGFIGNGSPGSSINFLIGGKADQNLWQRATTGSSVTTTITYGGPDRWAYWSGTNTAMTVSKVTTAAALPVGSANVFRMQRTASQTGVVQMCAMQELTSLNTYYLQGHTVEFDANVYTGANFSSTTGITVYISYGTGTDEGVSKMAFSLNAGGGGSAATGFANATAAAISGVSAVSTAYRVAAVANIPTTATEATVSLCYTPVGTAGTTDALYWDNAELRKADGLSTFANSTTGYVLGGSGSNVITSTINGIVQNAMIPALSIRTYEEEQRLQLAYYDQINEPAASGPVGTGVYYTTTECDVMVPLPVPMRAAPTVSFGGTALANTTFALVNATGATPAALATDFLDVGLGTAYSTTVAFHLEATTAAVGAAGQACELVGAGGGATIKVSAEL